MLNAPLDSLQTFKSWLLKKSELDSFLEEEMAWRYIKMNIDTTDESLAKRFEFFATKIEPEIGPYTHKLNQKIYQCAFLKELGPDYVIFTKTIQSAIELYREENIEIHAALSVESQEYGKLNASMYIEHQGERLTMQQASLKLKSTDRALRKAIYEKIQDRRLEDAKNLQELFDRLKAKRAELAGNCGFENYRDYMFQAMHRFDYSKQDCFDFHDAVEKNIVPIVSEFALQRKQLMELKEIRPYDYAVDPEGKQALMPFKNASELVEKSIQLFYKIDADFADCLTLMRDHGHFDLESKKGKAPGGFNYPLYESGLPFIYMNAVGSLRDLVTMMHEGGHAVHSYLTKDLPISDLKSFPSEVAELASMSMELISMDYWDLFFEDETELKRAKKEHLQSVISGLPWIALVDKFQHWMYEHPTATAEQRNTYWQEQAQKFSSSHTNWQGYEHYQKQGWLKQLHIFEVPFYYIEYGFAQLGAIAVWKNYKENPSTAIKQYKQALSLGGTRGIPEIYQTAGIQFNFDAQYVKELADFILLELDQLK